jgi:hypothetical protein
LTDFKDCGVEKGAVIFANKTFFAGYRAVPSFVQQGIIFAEKKVADAV